MLETRTADFQVAAIVPIAGAAADRDLAPVYPGITDADTLGDWDPPFPIDLKRVRPVDEALLEDVSDDAEGVHPVRGRAASCGSRATAIARRCASCPRRAAARRRARSASRRRCCAGARSRRAWASPSARSATEALAGVARLDRLRRVLRLLQLLPRRLGARAGGAVLPARRRAARARGRPAARRRLQHAARAAAVRRGRAAARGRSAASIGIGRRGRPTAR